MDLSAKLREIAPPSSLIPAGHLVTSRNLLTIPNTDKLGLDQTNHHSRPNLGGGRVAGPPSSPLAIWPDGKINWGN